MAKERIVTKRIAGHKAYFFRYSADRSGPGMGCQFSTLCEVGQPYIPAFEKIIKDKGLDLVTVDIDERPWVITVERSKE